MYLSRSNYNKARRMLVKDVYIHIKLINYYESDTCRQTA